MRRALAGGWFTQESGERVHVWLSSSAVAEGRRVHMGDPPVGAEALLRRPCLRQSCGLLRYVRQRCESRVLSQGGAAPYRGSSRTVRADILRHPPACSKSSKPKPDPTFQTKQARSRPRSLAVFSG